VRRNENLLIVDRASANRKLDYASTPGSHSADRIATRSFRIGLAMIVGVILLVTVTVSAAESGSEGLAVLVAGWGLLLFGSVWGIVEGIRAVGTDASRMRHAKMGLALNIIAVLIVGMVVAFAVFMASALKAMDH
jgi:hypothetical protein